VSPAQAFVNIATYTYRSKWDPWLATDPEAQWTVKANPEYVGSLVQGHFEPSGSGTLVKWSFTDKTKYPLERLMLNMYKSGLKASFEKGLENLKTFLESNPPVLSILGNIERGRIAPMFTLVIKSRGTIY